MIRRSPMISRTGTVTEVRGGTFLIQTNRNAGGAAMPIRVRTDAATTYTRAGKAASLKEIVVGRVVMVSGTETERRTISAASVDLGAR